MPYGSVPVAGTELPCQPSNVIGTSVSLRRIDRAYYQDRCDVHSDTSDDTYSPTRRDAKRSRREPEEGVHTASRSVDHVARSMPASAWRTPWTVAKPKTPAVAVRWRERRRSRPHPSRRRPNLTRNNLTQTTQPNTKQPHPKSTILKLGPRSVIWPVSECYRSGRVAVIDLKKERKQTTQGRDGRTARRHHTGILRRGVWF